jgi:hypothetical protein
MYALQKPKKMQKYNSNNGKCCVFVLFFRMNEDHHEATATDPFVTPGIEALLLQKAHETLADEASAQQVHQGDNSASTATHTEEGLLRKPTKISVFVRE